MSLHHDAPFRLNGPDFENLNKQLDRRNFLTKTSLGMGAMALSSLLGGDAWSQTKSAGESTAADIEKEILRALPHFAPKAKRVVFLFMSGGPSQFETFDYLNHP
mgnify:FL=1